MKRVLMIGLMVAALTLPMASAEFNVTWDCIDCKEGNPVTFTVTYTLDEDVDSVVFKQIALKDTIYDNVFAMIDVDYEITAAEGSHSWELATTIPDANRGKLLHFVPCATAVFTTTNFGVVEETYHPWLGHQTTYGEYQVEEERGICAQDARSMALLIVPGPQSNITQVPLAEPEGIHLPEDTTMYLIMAVGIAFVIFMVVGVYLLAKRY